ncbi:gp190 [Bacillus phage G]|uniref:Gp190 n=1 Tax=Bacillus phage G TaxID=2884420 RepID=G3MBQ6_9CAUD|nr:gp190 [Bacillus phage G]AEO93450.1 gp190 [Bacillus phage G]
MNSSEEFKQPTGHIGIILHRGGEYDIETNTVQGGELLEQIEFKNLIVNTASTLMAQRLAPGYEQNKNTGTFIADGLQYLAVGTIVDPDNPGNFNYMSPPPATVEQTKLEKELFRKEFTSWTFLDPSGNSTGNNPTNILRLATTFMENEAVGPLVEMGLFGGNATATADTGYMFNYKTFAVWNKPSDARLTVTWKLTF